MLIPERLLLYATSLVLGGVLFLDRGGAAGLLDGRAAPKGAQRAAAADGGEQTGDSTVLVWDDAGQPRVQTHVDGDGAAVIELKSAAGNTVVSLRAGRDGDGSVRVQQGSRFAGLSIVESGELKIELSEAAGRSAVMQSHIDGSLSLRLGSAGGNQAQMLVSASGETELSTRSGKSGIEAVVRTDAEGGGELAVHDRRNEAGTSISLLATGDTGLRASTTAGQTQAIVQVLGDGLAEVAVKGTGESQSGSSLVRLPNGVAAVSARLPSGEPGASMVTSPEGVSVVSVKSKDGENQAALWVNKSGTPSVYVSKPQDGASPKPPEKKPATSGPVREAAAGR